MGDNTASSRKTEMKRYLMYSVVEKKAFWFLVLWWSGFVVLHRCKDKDEAYTNKRNRSLVPKMSNNCPRK